jgi:hypothetical protein
MAPTPVDSESPRAVLYLATWLAAEHHADFSAWCDDHHREQLQLPGFLRARRFEWVASYREDDPPQFLTMYDLVSLDALRSDEYLDHMANSPGLPAFLRGALRLERRDCDVIAAHPASWWPPITTSLLDVFQLSDDALAHDLREHMNQLPTTNRWSSLITSLTVMDSSTDSLLRRVRFGPLGAIVSTNSHRADCF